MRRIGPHPAIGLLCAIGLMGSGCSEEGGSATSAEPTAHTELSPSPTPALRTVSADELASADLVLYTGEAPQGFDNGGYGLAEDEVSSPGPTITVAAGQELALVLFNVSAEFLEHDLTVVRKKDESARPLWGAQTRTIEPDESTLMTFTPQAPGSYFYICSLLGHTSGHGMWGRFIVEET